MAQTTVNHSSKSQLSAYNTKEVDQTGDKASSHFKTSIKKVTQLFASFFSLFFSNQNKQANHKKTVSDEPLVMISLPNKDASSRTVSFTHETSTKNLPHQEETISKASLTGNPRADAAKAAALHKVAQHKAQLAEKTRKNETTKLQQRNVELINNDERLSDIDREKNRTINLLGCAILKHQEYATSQGIFRTSGTETDINKLFNKVNDPKNGHEHLTQLEHYPLTTLTSTFKKIAGESLRKNNNIDFKSDISFGDLQACADAVKNKEDVTQQIKSNEQLKNKTPLILKNSDNRIHRALSRLAPPPLTLQLVTRFCALISNDEASHKMSIRNLAIIFAPHLINTSNASQHNSQNALAELEKEAAATQLAENYLAALIHQEKSTFHRL